MAILDAHIEVHMQWLVSVLLLHYGGFKTFARRSVFKSHRVSRAEPLLARIKEDRTVILTPVFDNVKYDDLSVTPYIPAADAFDWALWCMYESFRPEWYALKDDSQPGK